MISTWDLSLIYKISHRALTRLIQKYKQSFQTLGEIVREKHLDIKVGHPILHYKLNKQQFIFLTSLLPNHPNLILIKTLVAQNLKKTYEQIFKELQKIQIKQILGHVYLIENVQGHVRIGRSKNPIDRIKNQVTTGNVQVKNIFISEPIANYGDIETLLHKKYEPHFIRGEWFDVTFKKAKVDLIKLARQL